MIIGVQTEACTFPSDSTNRVGTEAWAERDIFDFSGGSDPGLGASKRTPKHKRAGPVVSLPVRDFDDSYLVSHIRLRLSPQTNLRATCAAAAA